MATVTAAGAGFAAAWLGAGSTGLLVEPLRIAGTWAALVIAVAAVRPSRGCAAALSLCAVFMAGLRFVGSVSSAHEVFLAAATLGILAAGERGRTRRVLLISALAVLVLAFYRLSCSSIAAMWLLSDVIGAGLGRAGAILSGKPLSIGASFAGLDFLVLSGAFYVAWLVGTAPPRRNRALIAAFFLIAGHFLYLAVLARSMDLAAMLPAAAPDEFPQPYIPPPWHWSSAAEQLLPWNLPLAALVLHIVVAGFMLRWARWPVERIEFQREGEAADAKGVRAERSWLRDLAIVALAVLTPVAATWSSAGSSLSGKTIVANQFGHLDWKKPEFDHYGRDSAGVFGMLPSLIESLGGRFRVSVGLAPEDLAGADVLLLLRPAGSLSAAQRQAIADFVRAGGALLVVGEPMSREGGVWSGCNEASPSDSIRVRRDVAISASLNWRDALEAAAHPAAWGIDPRRGRWFSDTGASLAIGWPARPLVVGRWGWSDPGSDAVLTESFELEAGDRWGDLVLCAEQRLGRGTVVVLGDALSLTNEGGVWAYGWTGRLLSYLANRPSSPQDGWRQALSLIGVLCLLVLLAQGLAARRLAGTAIVAAAALSVCASAGREATEVMPDGRILSGVEAGSPGRLAYLDNSHLEAYSEGSWGFDAINGLALTLMRHGYLTLAAPQLTDRRLEGAAIVVSIAPARRFSVAERRGLAQFVERGGVLIVMTGAEQASGSRSLLADFGLRVPESPVPTSGGWREPAPMGRFRSVYLTATDDQGPYELRTPFFAGWPVEADGPGVETLAAGPDGRTAIICRRRGRGAVVLIGDTGFAMNKNLEYIGGEPFDGRYESAQFWRWLIGHVTGRGQWIPPRPPEEGASGASESEEGAS